MVPRFWQCCVGILADRVIGFANALETLYIPTRRVRVKLFGEVPVGGACLGGIGPFAQPQNGITIKTRITHRQNASADE